MEDIRDREWRIQGRNGAWFVDEYRETLRKGVGYVWDTGTYGSTEAGTQRRAIQIAAALNGAYRAGKRDTFDRSEPLH